METVFVYLVLSLPLVGVYALLAVGITLIYQASRVLNLAHGALAMASAYTTYQAAQLGVPLPVAVVLGLAVGTIMGIGVERGLVRRLRSAGPTAQTVGTVAVLTLAIALVSRIWGTLPVTAPHVLPSSQIVLARTPVAWDLLAIFPVSLIGAGLLFALFQFTDIGLAMRGAAQNRRGAALRGVDPDKTSSLAWAIGGAYAGLAGILLAGATALDPFSSSLGVLPAFIAALIGRLESMPGVLAGAAVVGITQGMVPALGPIPFVGDLVSSQGAPQLVLGLVALVVMALRGERLTAGALRGEAL